MTAPTPDPLALAEEAERLASAATPGTLVVDRYDHGGGRMSVQDADRRRLVADTYHEGDRELFAVARDSMLALASALRAAHEENKRLVTQAAELGKWRDAVLNAAVVDWTYRKEHETDPVRAVNDLVCYALDVEREALRKENQRLREALMPLAAVSMQAVDLGQDLKYSVLWRFTEDQVLAARKALAGGKGEG